jgi:hypothetical protein
MNDPAGTLLPVNLPDSRAKVKKFLTIRHKKIFPGRQLHQYGNFNFRKRLKTLLDFEEICLSVTVKNRRPRFLSGIRITDIRIEK